MPATLFFKRRTETETFAVDFARRLDESEAIVGEPSVRVTRLEGSEWVNVSAEFAPLDAVVAESQVQFTLSAAATDAAQPRGTYAIGVRVQTDALRALAEIIPLVVDDSATV